MSSSSILKNLGVVLGQASKQAGRQASKQTSKQTSKQASKHKSRQASRQASKQARRQAGRQASTRNAFSRSHALEGLVITQTLFQGALRWVMRGNCNCLNLTCKRLTSGIYMRTISEFHPQIKMYRFIYISTVYCYIQIDSSLYLSLLLPQCNEFDQSLVVLPILNNGVPCSKIHTYYV